MNDNYLSKVIFLERERDILDFEFNRDCICTLVTCLHVLEREDSWVEYVM
jgi:hypothetical protein